MSDADKSFDPSNRESPRRRFRRWAVDLPAYLQFGATQLACRVFDVSPGGARVQLREGEAPRAGTELDLVLDDFGRIPCEIRHGATGVLGLMFLHDEEAELRLARFLIGLKPARPQVRRQLQMPASLHLMTEVLPCTVVNISSAGVALNLATPRELVIGDRVSLELPEHGLIAATIRYVVDSSVGLALIDGIDISQIKSPPKASARGDRLSEKVIRRLHKNAGTTAAGSD
jgi:PilZ domain